MRPRFLADAGFNHKILVGLRRREPALDFMAAIEEVVAGAPDSRALEIAAASSRILVSHDRKTMQRHFARFSAVQSSPGLIIAAQDLDIGRAIEDPLLIWVATGADAWIDRIGFIPI